MTGQSKGWRKATMVCVVLLLSQSASTFARTLGGFEVGEDALIPVLEITPGGPEKDGIPAIDKPRFEPVGGGTEPAVTDRVLGVLYKGVAKAYPISIMNWHEIVNDRFGDESVAVTFCPLCGSGIAYRSTVEGRVLSFGVSGLLYNSDVLLYDRQTESLWSQILSRAVTGEMRGSRLTMLPLTHTSWADWKQQHPDTLVLSRETGYPRDYDRDPYAGYASEVGLYFPVKQKSRRYHPKERVLGLEVDGRYKAYPFAELKRTTGSITDRFGGRQLTIEYDELHRRATILDANGEIIPTVPSFWFAWYAFHPETEVYTADD